MSQIRLTRKNITQLKLPAGKQSLYYWDETLPGFGILITRAGRKSYVMRFRENHKQINKVLGPCELLDLDTARDTARKFLAAMIILPVQNSILATTKELRHEPQPTTHDTTFASLSTRYIERHAKLHKESWKLDETRLRKYLLPAFGSLKLVEITRAMVASLHQEIGMKFPYQANRVREQISTMFELAKVWELIPESHPNPTKGIKDFEELHRKRWLRKTEVEKMIAALQDEPCLYIRSLFVLYLLTGARKRELMSIKWKNVDLEYGFIRIMKTKNKQIHELPLSSVAVRLLTFLPRLQDNEYVFPGKRRGQPYINIDKPWKRIRTTAGLLDVRIHDLRLFMAN